MVNMALSTAKVSSNRQEGMEILAFKTSPIQGPPPISVIWRGLELDLNLSVATEVTKSL